jgi:hypothetical protein
LNVTLGVTAHKTSAAGTLTCIHFLEYLLLFILQLLSMFLFVNVFHLLSIPHSVLSCIVLLLFNVSLLPNRVQLDIHITVHRNRFFF